MRYTELTSLPSEIGQLTSLQELYGGTAHNNLSFRAASDVVQFAVHDNSLTSLPAEIGQLTSLRELYSGTTALLAFWHCLTLPRPAVYENELTSLPPDIGELTSLTHLSGRIEQQ